MICPILSFDEVKFFFEKFKGGDANDIAYRTALIDTFVSKIFLYDGDESRIEIFCNANDKGIKIPLDKPVKGSSKGQMVRISGLYLNPLRAALKKRATIVKRILTGEADLVNVEESPYGEDVKIVRQHKLNLKLLTPAEKDEAVAKYESGMSMTAIANLYGCHRTTVGSILKGRGIAIRE